MKLFSHPYTISRATNRLIDEYRKYKGKLVIAFDFDNTIFDYHNNGGDYSSVISLLKDCSDLGFIMVLFTSNEDKKKLDWMVEYCTHFGIRVDYINESPIMKTRKPYYNILLDDRAGLEECYTILSKLVDLIKKQMIDANTKFDKN